MCSISTVKNIQRMDNRTRNILAFILSIAAGFHLVGGQQTSPSQEDLPMSCEYGWVEYQDGCYFHSKHNNNDLYLMTYTKVTLSNQKESLKTPKENFEITQEAALATPKVDLETNQEETLETYPEDIEIYNQGLKTYPEAEGHCRRMGGDLAFIHSKKEEELIYYLTDTDDDVWINSATATQLERNGQNHHNLSSQNSSRDTVVKSCTYISSSSRKVCISDSCDQLRMYICKKAKDDDVPQGDVLCQNCKSRLKRSSQRRKRESFRKTYSTPPYKDWRHAVLQSRSIYPTGESMIAHPVAFNSNPFHSRFSNPFEHLHNTQQKERFEEVMRSSMVTIKPPPELSGEHARHRLGFYSEGKQKILPSPPIRSGSINPHFNSHLHQRLHSLMLPLTQNDPNLSERAKEVSEVHNMSIASSTIALETNTTGSIEINTTDSIQTNTTDSIETTTTSMLDTNPVIPRQTLKSSSISIGTNDTEVHTTSVFKNSLMTASHGSTCQKEEVSYNGSCYSMPHPDDMQDFDKALLNCLGRGGLLVVISSFEEQMFLSELMQNIRTPIWIGLTSNSNETDDLQLTWADGLIAHKSFNKYINRDHSDGHCVTVTSNITELATWHLTDCFRNKYPYICKYKEEPKLPFGTGCIDEWEQVGERCYKVFPKPASWNESERHCTNFGAHLTSADSVEEEDILRRLLQSSEVSEFFSSFWVGLEIATEGNYSWTDGTLIGYLNWAEGQPDFHQEKEHCGSATRSSFRIHDSPCNAFLPFICEAIQGNMLVTKQISQKKPHTMCEDDSSWLLYNDHCYKIISSDTEDPQTWMESRRLCREIGGELASIHSVEENYWLQSKVYHVEDNVLWIGGLSYMDSGYEWADETPYDFTNWAKGEPNNNYDQEDCIALYTRKFGYWNDQNCGHAQGRICKRPLGTTHPPPVTTTIPKGNCQSGWIHTGTTCLKFNKEKVTFDDARKACKLLDHKADLVSIASAKEQAYITAVLGDLKANMWLGLRYEHGFHWMDQSALTYTNWAQGEPSSGGWLDEEHDENCVNTHIYNLAGQWNNIYCSALLGYICQTTPDPSIPSSDPLQACSPPFENYFYYSGKCYRPESSAKIWEEAENTCIKEGGHLASSSNRAETDWLWVVAQLNDLQNPWIGYNNRRDKNVFEWSDTWPTLYTKWGHGEPNISIVSHNCVTVGSEDGLWYLETCDQERPFICKYTNETFPTPDTPMGGFCPNDLWLDLGGSFCYLLVTDASPWTDANKRCAKEESNLASIHTKAELDLIVQAAHNIPDPMWIGLVQMKDGFGWSDGTGYDFINWKEGEPNSGGEECTEIYPGTGLWNDAFCSNARPFVCKTPKTAGTGNNTDIGVPLERRTSPPGTSRHPNAGTIAGIVISVLLLVLSSLLYLAYYLRKPKPLDSSGSFGLDNAVYSEDESGHMNLSTSFELQVNNDEAHDVDEGIADNEEDDEDT